MKKILLISAMAILTIATTKAQEMHFGVKGGLNLANTSTKDSSSDYKASFYVGAFGEYQLSDNLFGEVGLQFADNGGSLKVLDKKVKTSSYQVNVPIAVKYGVAEGISLKGGLYLGYLISQKVEGKSVEFPDKFNRFDYGLLVGAEYALPMGVFFEAGYNLGLSELGVKDLGSKNRAFQVGVGYKF